MKTGDYLEITNVVTASYLDTMYLSTTKNSGIKVCGLKDLMTMRRFVVVIVVGFMCMCV